MDSKKAKFTEGKVKEFLKWFAERERPAVLTERDTEPPANDEGEILSTTDWLENWHALRDEKTKG
jgi:hypothetical protein